MKLNNSLLIAVLFLNGCLTIKPDIPDAKNIKVANLISSNMVIQRGMESRIWGTAAPGGTVFVKINNQEKWDQADENGNWEVTLEPMPEGGPYEMIIEGKEPIKLTNVMVGDVWVCSGQSNMQWNVRNSKDATQEIATANHPNIRLFSVPRRVNASPQHQVEGSWEVCSPETIPNFSAVAYFFGKQLNQDLKIPIGLIHTSWGGTPAEAWTTMDSLKADREFLPIVERYKNAFKNYPEKLASYKKRLAEWKANKNKKNLKSIHDDAPNTGYPKGYAKKDFDDKSWKTMKLPQQWEAIMDIDGVVWFRKAITVPEDWEGKELTLELAAIDDFDKTYFNNILVGSRSKETEKSWITPRIYTVPDKLVKPGKAVIAVRVFDNRGGGGICGSGNMQIGSKENKIKLDGNWKYHVEHEMDPKQLHSLKPPRKPRGPDHPHSPAGLYNAMIHPLIKFPVKGVIWYQGESNAGRAYQYRNLLKTMIIDWRQAWQQGDFPFLIVQLANFKSPAKVPEESAWAELREAQAMALKLPNTGLAVAIDIGEADNIHPKNKQDVGKRLALAAEKIAYGKNIVYSGPTYESMEKKENKIKINFSHTGTGLIAKGGVLKQFAIAGEDKKFVWANAEINGKSVIVSSPQVTNPVAVRYAWADNPEGCNLYNREGLPAVPFRTDDWPGLTIDKK